MNPLNSQIDLVSRTMGFMEQNHSVISQNMANLNTPQYKTKQISFETFLKAAADNSQRPEMEVEEVAGLPSRTDGNNVDLDREIAQLKKNAMTYQTLAEIMASQISVMRTAITG